MNTSNRLKLPYGTVKIEHTNSLDACILTIIFTRWKSFPSPTHWLVFLFQKLKSLASQLSLCRLKSQFPDIQLIELENLFIRFKWAILFFCKPHFAIISVAFWFDYGHDDSFNSNRISQFMSFRNISMRSAHWICCVPLKLHHLHCSETFLTF